MQSSTDRHKLRNSLLSNGYIPLPLAAKGIYIKGWSQATITPEWLEQYRRIGRYPNTGIRCDTLLAFDIDVLDEAIADSCEEIVEEIAGPTEFCRIGQWPKRLLLYRLPVAKDAAPIRSGRTGKYGGHMCELLASHGRQFAAYGTHPGTGEPYSWEGPCPATAEWHALPSCDAATAERVMRELDAFLEGTGLERERRPYASGDKGLEEWDLTLDTEVLIDGEVRQWGELRSELTTDGVFGNLWREEYEDWGDSNGVHFYLAHGSMEPCAHDFVHDCTHWEGWTPISLPPPPDPGDNVFVPDDMSDLIENCVILRDKTVRRLDAPMRVYPLDGFVRSYQHLQVPDPNPPASNPNKQIPFTKVWEKDPKTLKADYAAMRPDKPDESIIRQGSERILNTYLPPMHGEPCGEILTFTEFLQHLIPAKAERRLFQDWLAHKVQHPGHRMHGMVMVTPAYGTGRGTLVQILEKLFGVEYVNDVELGDLVGSGGQAQYNAYLADSLIVTVREALEEREELTKWASRHIAYERLKSVCEPVAHKMHIRRKYGRNASEMVYASLFITSNHLDALAIEEGDRRLIVIDNTETKIIDAKKDLYARIHRWKDDPANIATLFDTLSIAPSMTDYDAFGDPPMTPAKARMIEAGQSDMDRLYEMFVTDAAGDVVTPAQWRQFAHNARMQYELDLPIGEKLDAALAAVISKKARRLEAIKGGMLKVKGRPQRPWIIRRIGHWKASTDKAAIRAEILKNGEPGGAVVALPSGDRGSSD